MVMTKAYNLIYGCIFTIYIS